MHYSIKTIIISSFLLFSFIYSKDDTQINVFTFNEANYFSATEFCEANNYRCTHYKDKSKIEFFISEDRVTFSQNSSYVKINDMIYHMAKEAQFNNGNFYIPIQSFMRLADSFHWPRMMLNIDHNKISILESSNILGYNLFISAFDTC